MRQRLFLFHGLSHGSGDRENALGILSVGDKDMSTYFPKEGDVKRKWFVIDATDQTLGRLASRAAHILAGKENPQYTPFIDTGDHVIVINAEKVKVTGMKVEQKFYHHYSGMPGGMKSEQYKSRINRRPDLILELAIKGMLPKNKIGRAMGSKLKVYRGDKHPHEAQQPQALSLVQQERN
jgi:large subunit ribosomal protein L13